MAYSKYSKGKSKRTSVRLTGLFKTKRKGMYVGSIDNMDDLIGKIKEAKKADKGLVIFSFRNEDAEEGQPLFTMYADVQNEQGSGPKKRKPIEDDDEDSDDEDSDKDDNVPF